MEELPQYRYDPWRFLKIGLIALATVFFASSGIYYMLGIYYGKSWPIMDCLFMVAISISTVGYEDRLGVKGLFAAEIFTMALVFVGIVVPAFIVSSITALVVDGTVGDTVRRKRMNQEIAKLSGHTIVCGAGCVGEHCVGELVKLGRKVVVVDLNSDRLKHLREELGDFLYVVGRADLDEILLEAGIKNADHLIACLSDDKNNLFLTLSAKVLNPNIRVVSEGIDDHVRKKMLIAGAASVVSPTAIGGLRLVSELIRPNTTGFLDNMLRDKTSVRFDEMTVGGACQFVGKTLAQINLREKADVLVVAVRQPDEEAFAYNPRANFVLTPNCVLVLLGPTPEIDRLRPLFA